MNANEKHVLAPCLWFDTEAVEATEFYCSIFPDSRIHSRTILRDTPSGDCDYLSFEIWGQRFESVNAGPQFRFNPSISFMVNFDPLFFADDSRKAAIEKLDHIWEQLSDGGQPLMELGEYSFSKHYG